MIGYEGLSPHVRGNPSRATCSWTLPRSIPACTGKPAGKRSLRSPQASYTRGLSPHVRGNPAGGSGGGSGAGSIPACTGKPRSTPLWHPLAGVYPRMYGETAADDRHVRRGAGLSPHVRGNRGRHSTSRFLRRSIPACTGKPNLPGAQSDGHTVYPRMYGETLPRRWTTWLTPGLSPHVRGNPG